MPPTLVVETGASISGANSYITAADIDLYMERIPVVYQADFDALGIYRKEQLCIWATQIFDSNICWPEESYTRVPGQSLQFPRIGIYDPDNIYLYNEQLVPQFIRDAVCQLAFELFKTDLTTEPPRGLNSLTVGPIKIDFDTNHAHDVKIIPRSVLNLISKYGGYLCGKRSGIYTVPLYRS